MKIFVKLALALLILCPLQIRSQVQPTDTNLHLAVLQGNLELVKKIVKSGSNLNEKDPYGSTPLIIASTFGKVAIAKLLIEEGADLSIANNQGSTPLHIAAFFCHEEIAEHLLNKGADKSLRNNDGATAYDIVAAPVEIDHETYKQLESALGPMGLSVDLDKIKSNRPRLAELLSNDISVHDLIKYTPLDLEDWEVSSPLAQGLDKSLLDEVYYDASHLETLYSLLIIKNGHLIGEGYFNEGSVNQLSKRASVTKSFVSALLGIAIEKKCITGIDQMMLDFFPDIEKNITDPRKKTISIEHMLQMQAGFPSEESEPAYWDSLWSGQYLDDIEAIPLTSDPGANFQYSNLTSNWLAIIVARACKTDLTSFGQENLFSSLKVKLGDWPKDLDGYNIGSGDIQFTARDMAKFGLLYLNDGYANGVQIVPANWVKESLQNYAEDINSVGVRSGNLGRYFHDIGYGYQWWYGKVGNHQLNFAWGHGGQLIILLKDLDMVIVTTADPFYGKEEHWNSWRHEKAVINVVGKFIKSLP